MTRLYARLYTKVLLWFLATVVVTGIGMLWVNSSTERDGPRPGEGPPLFRPGGPGIGGGPHRRMLPFLLHSIRGSYRDGGKEMLEERLHEIEEFSRVKVWLLDGAGKDILSGDDKSALLAGMRHPRFGPPGLIENDRWAAMPTREKDFWILEEIPQNPRRFWLFAPADLWVLLSVALFTFVLSYHLTNPLRQLQKAVERFGQGDLASRVRSTRRDEVGELSHTFDLMADRTEALVNSQRRLLADLSHELRTPLTRLGLSVELARSGDDLDAALDRIQREADRLNTLVGSLLQVSRGEADPGAVRKEDLQLDELLEAIVEECRLEGARIEYKPSGPITVHADAELLRRAIENVIRNSIKYAPESPIQITLEGGSDAAKVTVRDFGPGVPETALPNLFETFYRVGQGAGGYGLGLSIAKRAIELHHGSITARNASPGLDVRMTIPVKG